MIAALIPCGGRSSRMGRPKLLLSVAGEPLIVRVVRSLADGGTDRVLVVAPPPEIDGAERLAELARHALAEVLVAPAPTPDMRATVELGLSHLAASSPPDALLLTPGDSPGLAPALVQLLLSRWRSAPDRIVLPRLDGRRGHPLLLPWPLAAEIPRLPPGVGVNALLASHADRILAVDVDDPGALADLDTPEDYQRWRM